MDSNQEKSRAAIAEEAGEWFVANEDGPLDAREAAALAAWLRASPVHIEEFLGVSAIARDLQRARTDPEYSLEAILARARAEEDSTVQLLSSPAIKPVRRRPSGRWFLAAAAVAACALLSVGSLLNWGQRPLEQPAAPDGIAAVNFETRHGEQLTQRLADNSVLHLNTDSAVSIRYSSSERLVMLKSGQADFEVAHEAVRAFRVQAGPAEVIDLGTKFDVRLDEGSTVVTVVEGRVAVGLSRSSENHSPRIIQLNADQQVRVANGALPATAETVDAKRTTAWLHRQIAFDNEPLERVAAEYNRYTAKPIEIATPALRNLRISGVFATDDTDAFVAFLRSLKGVRVEVTPTRIRVLGD
jgi:transmembrane sensor